jgi:hypothetical protein
MLEGTFSSLISKNTLPRRPNMALILSPKRSICSFIKIASQSLQWISDNGKMLSGYKKLTTVTYTA